MIIALTLAFLITYGVSFYTNNYICPNGMNDTTRWGCGYSQNQLNQMKCEKIGGTYFYGGVFSTGDCVK